MIVDPTLKWCHCCQRGYPPAEMFFLPRFALCPECVAELATQMDRLSPATVDYLLNDVRELDTKKP